MVLDNGDDSFLVLDDHSILTTPGFNFRSSSFSLTGLGDGLRETELAQIKIRPNDESVDPSRFTNVVAHFSQGDDVIDLTLPEYPHRFVPQDVMVIAGEWRLWVSVDGVRVGAADSESVYQIGESSPLSRQALELCALLIRHMTEPALVKRQEGSLWSRLWGTPPTAEWPDASSDQLEHLLRVLGVSRLNFQDGAGLELVDQCLIVPSSPERKTELLLRLERIQGTHPRTDKKTDPDSNPEESQPLPMPLAAAAPVIAVGLIILDPSCTFLLLGLFYLGAKEILTKIESTETIWNSLDDRFDQWRRSDKEASATALKHLLSLDGPWRGEYEDGCRLTRETCGALSMQSSTAVIVLLSAWWTQCAFFGSTISAVTAVAAVQCWCMAGIICWRASQLTYLTHSGT
eukprot:TRINITY_DN2400_c0_g1_i16.p1 TRINITY_DN2400_c0_g1~~TRINITY_DN2400_c0_g1_i16.p1  ORF type:complete len:403 (+),score=56.22 TRINITY_DN2400_c0_g1_i16:248-1456(+)